MKMQGKHCGALTGVACPRSWVAPVAKAVSVALCGIITTFAIVGNPVVILDAAQGVSLLSAFDAGRLVLVGRAVISCGTAGMWL